MRRIPFVDLTRFIALVLSASLWALALSTHAAAKDKEAKPAARAKVGSADAPGFSIEKQPAWVQPIAVQPPSGLPPSSIQVMLIDRQIRLERSGSVHFAHMVRQINDSAGLQRGAQIEIEFDPTYQKLAFHQLAIWRNGQRIDKLDRKIVKLLHRETQLERQVIDGRMTASIVLEDLRVGDRVEWSTSLVGDNPVFNGRFVDIEWTKAELGPIGQLRMRLSAPVDRNIRYRLNGPTVQVESQVVNGWRETLLHADNRPQFSYDPYLPGGEYLKDLIDFSEFADWNEVAIWAEQLFAPADAPSAAVDQKIAEIQAAASSPEDQLRTALDFVQQDVRYFGTEIGADSHRPATPEVVLRQRFGDCKDKVALLTALVRRLGFKATPVLVSTQFGDEVAQRLPTPLAFNHAIAAVNVEGKTIWLDGTRSQQIGAAATRQPVGLGFGLLARSGSSEGPQELPLAKTALRSETVDTFSFPKLAQEGSLESATTYHGDMSEMIRQAQASMPPADFEKALEGELLRVYPTLVPNGAPQVESVPGQNASKVTLHFRTGDFWTFPDQRSLTANFALLALASELRLPDQNPRTQALRISMPGRYRQTVRFEFGEDIFTKPTDSRFNENNALFGLQIRYSGQTREQVIEGELDQTAQRIEAADWAAHRDRINKLAVRLSGTLNVPALSFKQMDGLRSDVAALETKVKRGDIKVFTPEQLNARARLAVLDRQLEGDRLPGKLRSEALVAQGTQLDHLGEAALAQSAFEEAIKLDGNNAQAHAALAVNALLRRVDDVAVQQADMALVLSPADVGSRYTRAWARYFAGDFEKSQTELQDILKASGEVERSYGGIWLYLANRRLGGDGVDAIRGFMPSRSKPDWPHPVLQWMSGAIDFDTALAATRENGQDNRGRQCELYFYAGQKALLDKDVKQARTLLRKSIATGVVEFNEYGMAQRELDRLDQRSP